MKIKIIKGRNKNLKRSLTVYSRLDKMNADIREKMKTGYIVEVCVG
jgi:hypothetical protein